MVELIWIWKAPRPAGYLCIYLVLDPMYIVVCLEIQNLSQSNQHAVIYTCMIIKMQHNEDLPEDDSEDIVSCMSSSAREGPSSFAAVTAEEAAASTISSAPCTLRTID